MPLSHLALLTGARPGDELPHRLRRQHAGDRRSDRDPPPRRCRCHDRRRRAFDDPSLRRHRLQPPHRPFHRQRQPPPRQPPVRRPPRRLRPRRRRGHGHPRNPRTRQTRGAKILAEVVGYGSTADAFRITDQDPDGKGAIVAMQRSPGRREAHARRHPLHQRPRHRHARKRRQRNQRHQNGLRRARQERPGQQHQEHDGPPHRRRRRGRVDLLRAGHPRPDAAADDRRGDAGALCRQDRDSAPRMGIGHRSGRRLRLGRSFAGASARCPSPTCSRRRSATRGDLLPRIADRCRENGRSPER